MANSRENKENRKNALFNLIFHYSKIDGKNKKMLRCKISGHTLSPQDQIGNVFENLYFIKKEAILGRFMGLPNLLL